jgi:uncharacterized protein (TIGR02145 family)
MKKMIIILVAIAANFILFAQQTPKLTFYLTDVSTKQYNISDIDNFGFPAGSSNYMMEIFYQSNKNANFFTKNIESIKFESDTLLNIYISGKLNSFPLSEIDSINFTIPKSVPQITSINPDSAKIGDEIIISGINFGSPQGTSIVSFKGKDVTGSSSWSDTQIKIKVPQGAVNGKLSVTVKNIKSNELDFNIIPLISSLAQDSGRVGDIIHITGMGFGSSRGTSTVLFNDTNAVEYSLWSDSKINVKVPQGAKTGKVSVKTGEIKSNEIAFIVLPKIDSIIPPSAIIGDTVIIAGTRFGTSKDTSYVLFNGLKVTVFPNWSDLAIKVIVPKNASNGKVSVVINGIKSNEVDFSIIPQITKVTPDSAVVGDTTYITGKSFGISRASGNVLFNDVAAAKIISWSDSVIIVKIPSGAKSGKISVNVKGNKSNEVNFRIFQHITAITPSYANIGDQVIISGTNFGDTQDSNIVLFNGVKATNYPIWQDSSINVIVPVGAASGNVTVKIWNKQSNSIAFTLIPVITSISPSSANLNSIVAISGSNFGSNQGSGFVTFNGASTRITNDWSNNLIHVSVPNTASSGKVSVTVGQNATSNSVDFTVLPSIANITPSAGLAGDQITITGASFGSTQGSGYVTFNGAVASVYQSWGDEQIILTVPQGANTGNVSVTAGGIKSNEVLFTLLPQITSINPTSGSVGAQVTIIGTNFGDSRGSNVVRFNTVNAVTYSSWSNTQIVATVPSGATTGNVIVVVNGHSSNGINFTVTGSSSNGEVTIGTQVWMLYNLDVTTYANGDPIPQVTDPTEWADQNITTGAWCYYNNDPANGVVYGKLYNRYAVTDPRGLAPEGWHIPSDAEFTTLSDYLGGLSVAGGKLKETGYTHWQSPNTGATNESGFTALGSGLRGTNGIFYYITGVAYWWTSSEESGNGVRYEVSSPTVLLMRTQGGNKYGHSVRCIKN